jgi:hypothetical protein
MKVHQKRSFQAFRRVYDWLAGHPVIAALVAPFLTALGTVLASLDEAMVKQDTHLRSAKGATAEAKTLRREDIADHMRLIAKAARVAIPDVVKMTAALQLPKQKEIDIEGLRVSAGAMADAAEQYQDALVLAGLPADTIAQLRSVAARYKAAIDKRGQLVAQRRGATESVDEELRRARDLVDAISVIVTRALRTDPATLAEWEQLKRVTVKGVQGKGAAVPTPAAPETTTPPASQAGEDESKKA